MSRFAVFMVGAAAVAASCGSGSASDPTISPSAHLPTDTTGDTTGTADGVQLVPVATGFDRPVDIAWREGDTSAYVVEQVGRVVRVAGGTKGDTVLDLTEEVSTSNEQGLLGIAFHPDLAFAYVNYTDSDGHTVIAEYPVGDDGGFDEQGARTVLTIPQPYENHNGGNIAFGPDGHLYIGMGDGGAASDPERRALDLGEPLGKILRIDPRPDGSRPYGIPSDNPFVDVAGALPEVWLSGVRNPWRFDFDPSTGDLWIGDVGQGDWEEIDVARAADGGGRGWNLGWSAWEGKHRANTDQSPEGAVAPHHEYSHSEGGCSVTGGTVYRGNAIPELEGWYIFGDYCIGTLWALDSSTDATAEVITIANMSTPTAIRSGPDGELYLLSHSEGTVLRLSGGHP